MLDTNGNTMGEGISPIGKDEDVAIIVEAETGKYVEILVELNPVIAQKRNRGKDLLFGQQLPWGRGPATSSSPSRSTSGSTAPATAGCPVRRAKNRGVLIAETEAFRKAATTRTGFTTAGGPVDYRRVSGVHVGTTMTCSETTTPPSFSSGDIDLVYAPKRRIGSHQGFIVQFTKDDNTVLSEMVVPLSYDHEARFFQVRDSAGANAVITVTPMEADTSAETLADGHKLVINNFFTSADSGFSITEFFKLRVFEWVDSASSAGDSGGAGASRGSFDVLSKTGGRDRYPERNNHGIRRNRRPCR